MCDNRGQTNTGKTTGTSPEKNAADEYLRTETERRLATEYDSSCNIWPWHDSVSIIDIETWWASRNQYFHKPSMGAGECQHPCGALVIREMYQYADVHAAAVCFCWCSDERIHVPVLAQRDASQIWLLQVLKWCHITTDHYQYTSIYMALHIVISCECRSIGITRACSYLVPGM